MKASVNQPEQSSPQTTQEGFSPATTQASSPDYMSTLAQTLQKNYYQASYLKSFLINQEDQPIVDKDDIIREETLGIFPLFPPFSDLFYLAQLQKKWVHVHAKAPLAKSKQAANYLTSTNPSPNSTAKEKFLTSTMGKISLFFITNLLYQIILRIFKLHPLKLPF